MSYQWELSVAWEYRHALLGGLWTSLLLTSFCIAVGTILSIPLALGLLHRNKLLRMITISYVEVMRALPTLVVLVWVYYVIPAITGLKISAFWTAAWVLAVNLSAFAADILRGGMIAIPKEHIEAAEALGMTRRTVIRRIVMPETFRRSVPALTSMYITMFKLSTLASVISVWELLHAADTIILDRFKPLEIYTTIAVLYLAVILPATYLAKLVERNRLFAIAPDNHL